MSIDWFTIGAQILNFLVLVYLLKRFLYPPVIRAIDEREKLIALRIKAAEDKMKQASDAEASYVLQKQELADERDKLIAQAREDAEKLRQALSDQARAEIDVERARWRTAVEQQKNESMKLFRRRAAEEVVGIARRTLRDLADEDLELRIVAKFVNRLQSIGAVEAAAIRKAVEKDAGSVAVSSAFDLPDDARRRIRETLHERIGKAAEPLFSTSSDIVGGIELIVGDSRIAWSLQSYMDELEQEVSKAMDEAA